MGPKREPDRTPGVPQRGWFHALAMVWTFMVPPAWSHAKQLLAVTTPVIATAALIATAAEIAASHAGSPLALALQAGGSVLALLVWTKFIAIPFATAGKLPDGRYLADVLAQRRVLHQRERNRRKALRQRRDRSDYQGPHAHQRQTPLSLQVKKPSRTRRPHT